MVCHWSRHIVKKGRWKNIRTVAQKLVTVLRRHEADHDFQLKTLLFFLNDVSKKWGHTFWDAITSKRTKINKADEMFFGLWGTLYSIESSTNWLLLSTYHLPSTTTAQYSACLKAHPASSLWSSVPLALLLVPWPPCSPWRVVSYLQCLQ